MNLKDQKKRTNDLLNYFIKSKKESDFNKLFDSVKLEHIENFLSQQFFGFWKFAKLYEIYGGLNSLKNDVLFDIFRSVKKNEKIEDSIYDIFTDKFTNFIKEKKEDITAHLPDLLEIGYSITYRNFFEIETIKTFSDFIKMEMCTIIYNILTEMLNSGYSLIFNHFILLLSKEQIRKFYTVNDFPVSLLEEMDIFWKKGEKDGLFLLLSIFLKEVGDLDQFSSFLTGTHLEIFQKRKEEKKNYLTIDKELDIIGSQKIFYVEFNKYLQSLDDNIEKNETINYSKAIWNFLCPPIIYNDVNDFIYDLFDKDENKKIFIEDIKHTKITLNIRRKIEIHFNFPKAYLEQYKFKTAMVELFPPL